MANASDIITYIGVPLAVLGVLPILYTFMLAILTQRRIRASLVHHGHRPVSTTRPHDGFTLRSSPMTSLIEVELPRYTIAPLERNSNDYWRTSGDGQEAEGEHHRLLDRAESSLSMVEEGRVRGFLRGGSWRAFHWKKLIVGRKLYRIQYEDELREPPAEINFSDLVHFLLDWGAVPDAMGWEKLRSGGLWTPAGTILLRKADDDSQSQKHVDWVLRTSMPDDSDGILSVSIRWTRDSVEVGAVRGAASLPPGWGRLHQPRLLESHDKRKEETNDLPTRIEELKNASKYSMDSSSMRFRAEDNRVQRLLWEQNNVETGFACDPFRTYEQSSAGLWFTCVASALLARKQSNGGLWAVEIPSDIRTFVRKDSIPCGLMVILGLLDENDAPQWSSEKDGTRNDSTNMAARYHQRFQARLNAERLESTMPPEQARVHKMNRQATERQEEMNDMMASMAARREREERRVADAIASPRMSNQAVARACLSWLVEKGEIGCEWTVEQLAEAVLYLMVVEQNQAKHQDDEEIEKERGRHGDMEKERQRQKDIEEEGTQDQQQQTKKTVEREAPNIIRILDEWTSWATAGGMKKQQTSLLDENKTAFCFAASLVAVVCEASASEGQKGGIGRAGTDMLECLRMWRKVRLG